MKRLLGTVFLMLVSGVIGFAIGRGTAERLNPRQLHAEVVDCYDSNGKLVPDPFASLQQVRSAIRLRPAAYIVRFGFAALFAHRASCARLILLRAAADIRAAMNVYGTAATANMRHAHEDRELALQRG